MPLLSTFAASTSACRCVQYLCFRPLMLIDLSGRAGSACNETSHTRQIGLVLYIVVRAGIILALLAIDVSGAGSACNEALHPRNSNQYIKTRITSYHPSLLIFSPLPKSSVCARLAVYAASKYHRSGYLWIR